MSASGPDRIWLDHDAKPEPMTPAEFAQQMAKIARDADPIDGDIEATHKEADKLLCDVLRSLGYAEGVGSLERMDRWYS